jgi:hypothetical protein
MESFLCLSHFKWSSVTCFLPSEQSQQTHTDPWPGIFLFSNLPSPFQNSLGSPSWIHWAGTSSLELLAGSGAAEYGTTAVLEVSSASQGAGGAFASAVLDEGVSLFSKPGGLGTGAACKAPAALASLGAAADAAELDAGIGAAAAGGDLSNTAPNDWSRSEWTGAAFAADGTAGTGGTGAACEAPAALASLGAAADAAGLDAEVGGAAAGGDLGNTAPNDWSRSEWTFAAVAANGTAGTGASRAQVTLSVRSALQQGHLIAKAMAQVLLFCLAGLLRLQQQLLTTRCDSWKTNCKVYSHHERWSVNSLDWFPDYFLNTRCELIWHWNFDCELC